MDTKPCPECEGTGYEWIEPCELCGENRGWIDDDENGGTMTCPACDGESEYRCNHCDGEGEIE